MFAIPTLADSIRVANNRQQYVNATGDMSGDWLAAEKRVAKNQPQPEAQPVASGTGVATDPRIVGAQNKLNRMFDQRRKPSGPPPVIGGTARGMKGTGGPTLEPNLAQNPKMSFGGTEDDGYRSGPGGKTAAPMDAGGLSPDYGRLFDRRKRPVDEAAV